MPAAAGAIAGYSSDTGLFAPDAVFGSGTTVVPSGATGVIAPKPDLPGYATNPEGAIGMASPLPPVVGAPTPLVPMAPQVSPTLFQQVKSAAINAVTGGKDSTFLDAVITHGQTALSVYQGMTGLSASSKEVQLADQARAAALEGNYNALNNALSSLTHEMNTRKGAALATMGASGFVTRRGTGGTMLDLIDGAISDNAGLQKKLLEINSANNVSGIEAQTAQAKAAAQATKMAAYGDLGKAGFRVAGAIFDA